MTYKDPDYAKKYYKRKSQSEEWKEKNRQKALAHYNDNRIALQRMRIEDILQMVETINDKEELVNALIKKYRILTNKKGQ